MNILVLYQSRSGHTRATADAVAQAARELGHQVVVKSVIEVRKADVDAADRLFVGTWVQGFILFGVRPAGADLWVPALPALQGKPVGIFCTFLFHPRSSLKRLAELLKAKGATVVGQRAFRRTKATEGVKPFVEAVLAAN